MAMGGRWAFSLLTGLVGDGWTIGFFSSSGDGWGWVDDGLFVRVFN